MQATKTIAAINAYYEYTAKQEFRKHLGASVVGKACARRVFYIWRWVKLAKFEGRMLRLFERGQLEENRFMSYLRNIGCEVWEFENAEKKTQWKISDVEGHFGGSLDGVGRGLPDLPPDMPFLIECKTHNAKSFAKLQDEGLMKSKWEHFIQAQTYAHKKNLPACLYMAVNKDTDELYLELVMLDKEQAERTIERGRSIIYATEAPMRINKSPGYYLCKSCDFQQLCHFKKELPHRNCRTCKFSKPMRDGSGNWECLSLSQDNIDVLDEAAQLAGCEHYVVNPGLFSEP